MPNWDWGGGGIKACLNNLLSCMTFLGTAQLHGCSLIVCLSQQVTYQCISGTNISSDILRWKIHNSNGDQVPLHVTTYSKGETNIGDSSKRTFGQFTTILIESSGPLVSNISFISMLNISNYTVNCDTASTPPVSCLIQIASKEFCLFNFQFPYIHNLSFTFYLIIFNYFSLVFLKRFHLLLYLLIFA